MAEFSWTLYSSDTYPPYLLTGKRSLRGEERATAERCLRFLATDGEYAWPDPANGSPNEFGFYGCASFFALGLGVLLVVATLPALFAGGVARSPTPMFFAIGIALIAHWRWYAHRQNAIHQAWLDESTPFDFDRAAWPFARGSDIPDA